jgi:hypothetical protein
LVCTASGASRDLRAASIRNELRSGKDADLQVLSARIAIVHQGEVAETVLFEALSFDREGPSMSFARDSVIPTNAGNVLSIPHKDARIMDVSMTFRPSLLFKFRSTPAVFDGLKVHFGVSLFVLDPNGHERTRNEFRGKVVRDNGFWVQGTLRPW